MLTYSGRQIYTHIKTGNVPTWKEKAVIAVDFDSLPLQ